MSHNRIGVVIGRKGSGKSVLIGKLILSGGVPRPVLILDPLDEYGRIAARADDSPNTGSLLFLSEAVGTTQPALAYLEQQKRKPGGRWRIVPEADAQALAVMVMAYATGGMTLVIDEVSMWQTPAQIPLQLSRLFSYGRHQDLNLLVAARRPAEIHRLITSQADVFYIFKTTEPRDLQYLAEYLPGEIIGKLSTLDGYHFYRVDLAGDTTLDEVRF